MKVLQILPSEIPSETGECVPMFAFRESSTEPSWNSSSSSSSSGLPVVSAHSTVAELELAIPPQLLRKGKWSPEEEQYTLKLMELFKEGVVDCVPGISLRIYLAKKLNCEPMRITKKYAGTYAVGKIVFLPQHGKLITSDVIQDQMKVLTELEDKFVTSLNQYAMMESAINMTRKTRRVPLTTPQVGVKKQKKNPDTPHDDHREADREAAAGGHKGAEPEDEPKDPVPALDDQDCPSGAKGRAWQSYLFKVSPK